MGEVWERHGTRPQRENTNLLCVYAAFFLLFEFEPLNGHSAMLTCHSCAFETTFTLALARHVARKHGSHVCGGCGIAFLTANALRGHLKVMRCTPVATHPPVATSRPAAPSSGTATELRQLLRTAQAAPPLRPRDPPVEEEEWDEAAAVADGDYGAPVSHHDIQPVSLADVARGYFLKGASTLPLRRRTLTREELRIAFEPFSDVLRRERLPRGDHSEASISRNPNPCTLTLTLSCVKGQ
jgi:hypothetical protein